MKLNRTNQKGTTFIELLAYLAIFAVVFGSVISFTVWTLRANAKFKALEESQENGKTAMQNILLEVRSAKGVYTPTFNVSQLSLETTANSPVGETASYIDFFLCESRLCLKREGQNPIALTSNKAAVKNLNFSLISESAVPSVVVSFDVEYPGPENTPTTISLKSAASLRNY